MEPLEKDAEVLKPGSKERVFRAKNTNTNKYKQNTQRKIKKDATLRC